MLHLGAVGRDLFAVLQTNGSSLVGDLRLRVKARHGRPQTLVFLFSYFFFLFDRFPFSTRE